MPVMHLRSLTLTKEAAAITRVAYAALAERTDILSPEGREVLVALIARLDEVILTFPQPRGVAPVTLAEANHRDAMIQRLKETH